MREDQSEAIRLSVDLEGVVTSCWIPLSESMSESAPSMLHAEAGRNVFVALLFVRFFLLLLAVGACLRYSWSTVICAESLLMGLGVLTRMELL